MALVFKFFFTPVHLLYYPTKVPQAPGLQILSLILTRPNAETSCVARFPSRPSHSLRHSRPHRHLPHTSQTRPGKFPPYFQHIFSLMPVPGGVKTVALRRRALDEKPERR